MLGELYYRLTFYRLSEPVATRTLAFTVNVTTCRIMGLMAFVACHNEQCHVHYCTAASCTMVLLAVIAIYVSASMNRQRSQSYQMLMDMLLTAIRNNERLNQ